MMAPAPSRMFPASDSVWESHYAKHFRADKRAMSYSAKLRAASKAAAATRAAAAARLWARPSSAKAA